MEAEPTQQPPTEPEPTSPSDPSEEVADSTAPLLFHGKGLDPEIEKRYEDDRSKGSFHDR